MSGNYVGPRRQCKLHIVTHILEYLIENESCTEQVTDMLTSDYVPLTKEQQDVCLEELGYSRKQLSEDVETIKDWLNQQEHLPSNRKKVDDFFLANFLMGCKGSLEKSKNKLDAFFSLKSTDCVVSNNLDPLDDDIIKAQTFIITGVYSKAFPDGTRVTFTKINPENYRGQFVHPLKAGYMVREYFLREERNFCPNKWICIIDAEGITPDILGGLSVSLIREAVQVMLHVLPYRIQQIVFINCPPFMEFTTNYLIKPLLSQKLRERFTVTAEGGEFLKNLIPKDTLPKDYGGDGLSQAEIHGNFVDAIKSIRHLVKYDWNEKTDESKRPLSSSTDFKNSLFGLHGSIKKLSVD